MVQRVGRRGEEGRGGVQSSSPCLVKSSLNLAAGGGVGCWWAPGMPVGFLGGGDQSLLLSER